MDTMTRPAARLNPPTRGRRHPIVLKRSAGHPTMVTWARIAYERRMARRAALRRAWRVVVALVVGVSAGIAMYALASAGLVPLLEGGGSVPSTADAAP